MSGAMSKRQQARNEKTLHDLVHDVPGNTICADCHARNPGWASWSLGVFLCMRCAAIHRKLGTHISKVKSLTMDSWSNEQVDNMRKVGNVVSNQIYNPENKRPPVPIDADEADSAMERFIRQKYMNNVAAMPGKPQSPRSDEGTPPPLPPKNSSKFGFRSASSIFPLSSRSKKEAKVAALQNAQPSSPGRQKPARVFGAALNYDDPEDLERKVARLRDMGFSDPQRNAMVLKGVNGNLERAVESLIRLGEGDKPTPPIPSSESAGSSWQPTRSASTPLTTGSGGLGLGLGARKASHEQLNSPSSVSTNPFDMMPPAQPQTAQSTGTIHQNNNPYARSMNPLGGPMQQDDFTRAFQGLNIAPQPPLFPHHTGGPAGQMPNNGMPQLQQQFAPSAPTSPVVYQSMGGFTHSMTYPQPSPIPSQPTGYNPFLQSQPPPMPQQQPQYSMGQPGPLNTGNASPIASNNPFARSPTRIGSPSLGQIPEQSQTMFQSPQPLAPVQTGNNPFFSNTMQQSPAVMTQQPPGQQGYFRAQRPDKASIMALYNQPQPMSPVAQQPEQSTFSAQPTFHQTPSIPENHALQTQMTSFSPVNATPVSASSMGANSNNPFLSNMSAQPAAVPASDPFRTDRKISRESMNLGMDLAWTNGRHSPDAFASLSARHG